MEAKHTDMRINHENHRESPHRINILYPSFCHNCYKNTKNLNFFRTFETLSKFLSFEKTQINLVIFSFIRNFAT